MTTAIQDVRQTLFNAVGFVPTEAQQRVLDCPEQFIIVTGGEQAGKSVTASKYFLSRFGEVEEEPAIYWLVASDYEGNRREFEYIASDMHAIFGDNAKATKRLDPGEIVVWGSRGDRKPMFMIKSKSANDPSKLRMEAPHGIIVCEGAQLDLESFERTIGRATPNDAWVFISGTLEGSLGWYPQVAQAWSHEEGCASFRLPSYSNTYLYPGGKNDPKLERLKRMSSDSFYMERIEGKPVPPKGLVFPEFNANFHVKPIQYVKGEPVYLWIDPGYSGAHAVEVIQEINGQIWIIDEIYERLITDDIIDIAMKKPWWTDVKGGAIDIAGTQHQAMPAPVEVWAKRAQVYLRSQRVPINQGTERLKSFLKFDPLRNFAGLVIAPHCQGVLSEFGVALNPHSQMLQAYRWRLDRNDTVLGQEPEDRFNHGIKALVYGLVDRYGYVSVQYRQAVGMRRWDGSSRRDPRKGR